MVQRTRRRGVQGFTRVELAFAIAIVGLLVALAVPAWVANVRRRRTAEASTNIRGLFTRAAAYYATEHVTTDASTRRGCTVADATSSNVPGPEGTVVDWSMESPSFQALGFSIGHPIQYQYAIARSPGSFCDVAPGEDLYAFQARGDLDGDGIHSFYEITARSDQHGNLVRSPGVQVQQELE